MSERRPFSTPSDFAWAVAKFELRTWARAKLFAIGEFETIHDAVDPLVNNIQRSGLTTDEAQRLMAATFHQECWQ